MQDDTSSETLANIAKNVNVLMCIASVDGYFTYVNHYWPELLGWTLDELKVKPFVDFIHPDDVEISISESEKISRGSERVDLFRNRFLKKEGGYLWIEWKGVPGDDGQIIASGQDVTQRVLSEQQNESNLRLLEQVGIIGQIGHWSIDFKTRELFWSEQVYIIHGVSPDEYTPDVESAINFYHPDDVDEVQRFVDAALKGSADWQFNLRIIRPSGEIRHVVSKAQISRDVNGNPSHVFGVFQDVTERENLSERLRLISQVAENSITGVVITDELSRVVWVNNAFTELSGYQLDEVEGHTLGTFLQGDETSQATIEEIKLNLAEKRSVDVEIFNYRKDKSTYWINLLISPVISNHGKLTHFIGFQQDITERKKQEKLIADNQRREVINQMASGICHDFNNVLAVVMGNVELIEVNNTENISVHIGNIKTAIERAQSITQRLLKMSRSSQSANAVLVNIDDELAGICSMLKETIPSNIQLVTNLHTNGYALVNKDDLIDSVINLIINAKHAIPHHGRIEVSAEITHGYKASGHYVYVVAVPQNADEYIKLTVSDDGCGIPSADFQHVFTPFYTTRTDDIGTGLGLSLLSNFAVREKLGLVLESAVGKGTEISIYLPLREGSKAIDCNDGNLIAPTISGLKIVLIDDEPMLLELNNHLLSQAGALVSVFENPHDALQYIQQSSNNIDIVITDHFMPGGILGSDVVNIINDMYPHIPCIILSGNPMDSNLRGIGGKVVAKPIKLEGLKSEILSSLKSKRLAS